MIDLSPEAFAEYLKDIKTLKNATRQKRAAIIKRFIKRVVVTSTTTPSGFDVEITANWDDVAPKLVPMIGLEPIRS